MSQPEPPKVFEQTSLEVKTVDPERSKTPGVREMPKPVKSNVQDFVYQSITDIGQKGYDDTKRKMGSFAATDADRRSKKQGDSRFKLSGVAREKLFIEEEERRAIEERVRKRVEAYSEEVRGRAQSEGYEIGRKEGYEAASKEFQAQSKKNLDQIEAFIAALEGAKASLLAANEGFLMELIHQMVGLIALKEIKTDDQYLIRLAKEIIERSGVRENIILKISTEDSKILGMLKEGLEQQLGQLKNLNIVVSDEVRVGGCIVETEWSAIDASLKSQLENLHSTLKGSLRV